MASRWRVWGGEAHVDSHGHPPKIVNQFKPVEHEFDWNDIPNLLKNVRIPEGLVKMINETNSVAERRQMRGIKGDVASIPSAVGRAEILRMRLKVQTPGSSRIKNKKSAQSLTNTELTSVETLPTDKDFIPDKQTLYFKHLPRNLTEKELEESISQFGEVSVCKIYRGTLESVALVRLKEASACDWVISFYRGMPYDDECVPLECDYVLEIAEILK